MQAAVVQTRNEVRACGWRKSSLRGLACCVVAAGLLLSCCLLVEGNGAVE